MTELDVEIEKEELHAILDEAELTGMETIILDLLTNCDKTKREIAIIFGTTTKEIDHRLWEIRRKLKEGQMARLS